MSDVVYGVPSTFTLHDGGDFKFTLNEGVVSFHQDGNIDALWPCVITAEDAVALGEKLIKVGVTAAKLREEQKRYDEHVAAANQIHVQQMQYILDAQPPR